MKRRWAWLLLIPLVLIGWWGYHRLTLSRIVSVSSRTGHDEIYSMNADGSDVRRLTHSLAYQIDRYSYPTVSPDGKLIVYTAWIEEGELPRQIRVMDSNGERNHQLKQNPSQYMLAASEPAFSADSKHIYCHYCSMCTSTNSSRKGIFCIDLDGPDERQVNSKNNYFLACSHDGKMLVYDCLFSAEARIFRANPDGSHERQLTHGWYDIHPAISPDGTLIAFSSNRSGKSQVFLMDTHGSNLRQLTHESSPVRQPSFSPDGQQIVYDLGNYGNMDICTIYVDGHGRKALTHNQEYWTLCRMLSQVIPFPLANRLRLDAPGSDSSPIWAPYPQR